MNNLAPMKNCPGELQGNLNWMSGVLSNVYKIRGAHLQCVNHHYAKFDYKRIKTVGVTDNLNQRNPLHFRWKNVSNFNTTQFRKYSSKEHKIGREHN